jgi:hypothetical protein
MHALANVFNISVVSTPSNQLTEQSQALPLIQENKDTEEVRIDQDFDNARSNIVDALTTAKLAVEYMFTIAKEKEDPKSFDTLNNLLKNVTEASRQLVDLYNRKQEFKDRRNKHSPQAIESPVNIQNAVFTGTPAELKDFLKNMKKDL